MIIGSRTCRGCGCTDERACPGGCSWVLFDIETPTGICSVCAEEMEFDPQMMATAFCDAAAIIIARAAQANTVLRP